MTSLSASLYGASMNKGMGGLMSGLDTDDLVKQMTAATRNKINRQYQSKQILLYRQESYREISKKLLTFSDKYFSYASGTKTNILSPSFFESNTFKPSSSYVNVTGNAENIKNFSIDSITGVATAANFTSSKKVTNDVVASDEITDYFSSLAGQTMTLEYDEKSYTITIDKDFGRNNEKTDLQDVVDELNEQLAKITDKDGKKINESNELLKYQLNADGNKLEIVTKDGIDANLTAASNDILNYLNLKTGQKASSTDAISAENIEKLSISKNSILYSDDSYINFEYNGVLKKINFSKDFTTSAEIETHLKNELNNSFGDGKIDVSYDGTKFSFTASGENNIFGVSSISKDLSILTGIESGDYNRLNKTKSIVDLGLEGITEGNAVDIGDGKKGFIINVNDTEIKIETTMSITDVINKINSNAKAGVKVYYSSTTNTFSAKATETGLHKGVSITDVNGGGNLATAIFGSSVHSDLIKEGQYLKEDSEKETETYITYTVYNDNDDEIGIAKYNKNTKNYYVDYTDNSVLTDFLGKADYIVNSGTDTQITYTLNGVQSKITRSTANFTIDEINIELNEKAKDAATAENPITFDVTNNTDEIVEKVKQFIDDYNEIINLIGTKTSEKPNRDYLPLYPEQQDEMKEEEIKNWNVEAKKGVLYGDSKMNMVLRRMREAMSGLTEVSPLTLSGIGISSASMDTSGKLVLDEKKFKEKLIENPDEIGNLFTNTSSNTNKDAKSGIALQLQQILRDNVGTYGTTGLLIEEAGMDNSMTSDKNFITDKMEQHDDKMAQLKKTLERERQRYWNQFSALEQSLNKLNAQSSWLTDMMGGN